MRTLKPMGFNSASYVEFYNKHYPRVVRLSRLLLSDLDEAEEVGQDVFLKAFRQYRKTETFPQSGNRGLSGSPSMLVVTGSVQGGGSG